jgi:hypothetical protein
MSFVIFRLLPQYARDNFLNRAVQGGAGETVGGDQADCDGTEMKFKMVSTKS